jgi:hypothetical protein
MAASAERAEAAAEAPPPPAADEAPPASPPAARPPPACEECGAAEARYRCPRCARRTCSAACVAAHKAAAPCSGKRDRAAYVGRRDFDERALLRDYRLLEEAARADDAARRARPPAGRPDPPPHLRALVAAAARARVRLELQAPGMARRRANTTRLEARGGTLAWRVEWRLPAAGLTLADARLTAAAPLRAALDEHLAPPPGGARAPALEEYAAAAAAGALVVVARVERRPADAPRFHRVDPGAPLAAALAGRVVVEFPTLLVLLPREAAAYPLLEEEAPAAAPAAAGAKEQAPAAAVAGDAAAGATSAPADSPPAGP